MPHGQTTTTTPTGKPAVTFANVASGLAIAAAVFSGTGWMVKVWASEVAQKEIEQVVESEIKPVKAAINEIRGEVQGINAAAWKAQIDAEQRYGALKSQGDVNTANIESIGQNTERILRVLEALDRKL